MTKALPKGKQTSDHSFKPGVGWRNYAEALFLSFYSSELYVDVIRQWRGLGLRYLFLLSLVLSIPWSITEYIKQANFYNTVALPVVKKIPTIPIKHGKVDFNQTMPYLINDKAGSPVIVIDTSATLKDLDKKAYSKVLLLITEKYFIYHYPGLPPTIDPIEKEADGVVNASLFLEALSKGKMMFIYSLYPTLVASLMSGLFILSLLFGFIAMSVSLGIMKYNIKYRQSIKLTAVAMTPMATLLFVIYLNEWMTTNTGLLLFCVLLAYYIFGIRANKHAPKNMVVYE